MTSITGKKRKFYETFPLQSESTFTFYHVPVSFESEGGVKDGVKEKKEKRVKCRKREWWEEEEYMKKAEIIDLDCCFEMGVKRLWKRSKIKRKRKEQGVVME